MAAAPAPVALVFFNDGGHCLLEGIEDEDQQEALLSLAEFVQDSIFRALNLSQFRHVQVVEQDTSAEPAPAGAPSAFSLAFAPAADANGEVSISDLRDAIDLRGLLASSAGVTEALKGIASIVPGDDEEGVNELQCSDEELAAQVAAAARSTQLEKRWTKFVNGVQGDALQDALIAVGEAVPEDQQQDPLEPFDVVQMVLMHVAKVAGVSPPRPSLLRRGRNLVGSVVALPAGLAGRALRRLGGVQKLWWRVEDIAVEGGKAAFKLARKSARPLLIAFVLHRTLKTLERSRGMEAKMSKMSPDQATDYYYSRLLGKDWKDQLQADWDKAVQDVNDGLVTDEINHEKRKMSAAAIRRLEIEDWDKERMKNFYLSSFGGLQWYAAMEQALHNPMFITSRGWTENPKNWVGENNYSLADHPGAQNWLNLASVAIGLKEKELGRRLTGEERQRVVAAGAGSMGWAGLAPEYVQRSSLGSGAEALAAAAALAPAAPAPSK